MRTKKEILKDATDVISKVPAWDTTASLHERLTIEVLIDIRDGIELRACQIIDRLSGIPVKI